MKSRFNPLAPAAFLALAAAPALADDPVLVQWAPAYRIEAMKWTFTPPSAQGARPVFVHVGAFGQELSRAMAKQTFAAEAIHQPLTQHFQTYLIDRDEEPEWAALAQSYLGSVKQGGGWPANLWLTPDLKPFEGGAYLPPTQEWGGEGFRNVLDRAGLSWEQNPEEAAALANEAVVQMTAAHPPAAPLSRAELNAKLDEAAGAWLATYDAANGGFGEAPRYAEPETLAFLVLRGGEARRAALATLERLAKGALRSPEGGVYRRSSDAAWQQPVKLLLAGDQARLALAFVDAAEVSGQDLYASEAARLLAFTATRLQRLDGGIRHGIDATETEGAPVFVDDRAFADENGLVLHALLSLPATAQTPELKRATDALGAFLQAQATAPGGLVHRAGGTAPATLQDSVWVTSALARAGRANARSSWSALLASHYDSVAHRLRAVPEGRASLPFALAPVPPGPGDAPSAEASLLLAAQVAGLPLPSELEALCLHGLTIESATVPRGDLLLAAQLRLPRP